MKRTSQTFTIEYIEYEIGDIVLIDGEEHEVEKFAHPFNSAEDPTVFIKGYKWGVSTRQVSFVRGSSDPS